jgi:cytoskeletal protein CcmA (bactofilin family)
MRDRKKRILFVVGLVALASFVLAAPVLAADIRSNDVIVIDEDVNDDLYLFAGSITVNSTVHGDLIAAGGDITINGTIDGDLWAAGGRVHINGTVADDVRIAGSDLKLGPSAKVGDDLFAAGFGLGCDPGSTIASDVFVAGYQALLGGDIGGNVTAAVGGFELTGHVVGNVQVEVGEPNPEFEQWSMFMRMNPYFPERTIGPGLSIKDDAQIDGELTYTSPATAQIPEGAVGGPIVYQTPVPEEKEAPQVEVPEVPAGAITAVNIIGWFVRWIVRMVQTFMSLLVIGVLMLWLIPKWLKEAVRHWKEKPLHSLGWGFVIVLAFPVALFTLFVVMVILDVAMGLATLGGLVGPITGIMMVLASALTVAFWTVAVYVTKVAFCYLVGWLILKRPAPAWVEKALGLIPLLVGLVIFTLVRSIPFLGAFFSLWVTIFGLGALWLLAWVRIYKPKKAASA